MTDFLKRRYWVITLDPVHVGSGGYRLGRVDNTIIREPGTLLPKIPSTSIHGVARSGAARLFEQPKAAGKDQRGLSDLSGDPVCYTFGYVQPSDSGDEAEAQSYSGVLSVFDAHILFFPVHTMVGPVWVSTAARLRENDFRVEANEPGALDSIETTWERGDPLNLGYLMLHCSNQCSVRPPIAKWEVPRWEAIAKRIALVHPNLFSEIVNSNLDVRTSVSIDIETGAASDGALFTYEAIPRATFLGFDVVMDDFRKATAENPSANQGPFPVEKTARGSELYRSPWIGPLDVFSAGLGLVEWLGIGGMGTRGFGRIAVVADPMEMGFGEDSWR